LVGCQPTEAHGQDDEDDDANIGGFEAAAGKSRRFHSKEGRQGAPEQRRGLVTVVKGAGFVKMALP
jgi:hypothetical protein